MRARGVAACARDQPGGEGLAARLMLHLPYYVSLQFPNFLQCELDDGSMYELMILSPVYKHRTVDIKDQFNTCICSSSVVSTFHKYCVRM